MLCHLSILAGYIIPLGNFLGPFLIWQIMKNEVPSVETHAKDALNFQFTVFIVLIAGFVIAFVLSFFCIGYLLFPVLGVIALCDIILPIIAGVKANNGVAFKFTFPTPRLWTGRLDSSGNQNIFLSGVLEATRGANNYLGTLTNAAVGMDNGGHYNGDLAEIVVYNRDLSDTERETVEQRRWNNILPTNGCKTAAGLRLLSRLAVLRQCFQLFQATVARWC